MVGLIKFQMLFQFNATFSLQLLLNVIGVNKKPDKKVQATYKFVCLFHFYQYVNIWLIFRLHVVCSVDDDDNNNNNQTRKKNNTWSNIINQTTVCLPVLMLCMCMCVCVHWFLSVRNKRGRWQKICMLEKFAVRASTGKSGAWKVRPNVRWKSLTSLAC